MSTRSLLLPAAVSAITVAVIGAPVQSQETRTAEKKPQTQQQPSQQRREHPLKKAIGIAKESVRKMEALGDYQADLVKKEVIGNKAVTHQMRLKIRHKPFSVYMYFKNPNKGREVLYVEGKNDGKLLAHGTSTLEKIVGTVSLNPTSTTAMQDNRHPITKIGILRTTEELIKQWESESRFGETEVKYYPDAKIDTIACKVIESSHPRPRKQFKFQKTRLWIDARTGLPIRLEQFGFPRDPSAKAPLLEQYTYRNLTPNMGLTDRDFDKRNPRYAF